MQVKESLVDMKIQSASVESCWKRKIASLQNTLLAMTIKSYVIADFPRVLGRSKCSQQARF
jgi:hypothetical protein